MMYNAQYLQTTSITGANRQMNLTGENLLNFDQDYQAVNGILSRRNLKFLKGFSTRNLVFGYESVSAEDILRLYELLKKYSFRLFLKDVIKSRDSFSKPDLIKFAGEQTVENYICIALNLNIIEPAGEQGVYKLKKSYVETFGDTLEWFVSRVMRFEFFAPAGWGIKLRSKGVGGDYDVLGLVENRLVYIETKSAPPAHIEQNDMCEFISRISIISPEIAIFLVDTSLCMKDKIVPYCRYALRSAGIDCEPENMGGENYRFNHGIYIINSAGGLILNLKKAFADFFIHKGICLK